MSGLYKFACSIRSALFYLGYAVLTVVWGTLGLLVGWLLPYRKRFNFIVVAWTFMVLTWLRWTCGIKYEVSGLEHRPDEPCIVFARHESTWETLMLQQVFAPQATLIKKELLAIPFFGWAFSLLRPIAIDRSSPRGALRQLIKEGSDRLERKIWVVLFPEGTRLARKERAKFQPGGAALAAAAGRPICLVAHNAGDYWPARQFTKYPGTIRVQIAPPFSCAGMNAKTINQRAAAQLDLMLTELDDRLAASAESSDRRAPAVTPGP